MAPKLNILTFHRIVKHQGNDWTDVKLDLFKSLLTNAIKNKQHIVSIDNWSENNYGDLAFSFDDGHLSDYEIIFPLLQKFNIYATFFIVPKFVGKEGYMTWFQIKKMSDFGMEIASHSESHPYLTTLPKEELIKELRNSKTIIENNIGKKVNSFSYPYGDCSKKTHNLVRLVGYKNICNSNPGLTHNNMKVFARNSINYLSRIENIKSILKPKTTLILKNKISYIIYFSIKRALGINNYLKLRGFFFGFRG